MTPQLKFILCLFAIYAVELVVTNAVNPPDAPELTTPSPVTPAPVNPTEQPKPTTATPATPAPVNPTEQPKPTTATPATPAPVNPTEQPKPTMATPATPAPVNPTEQPKPTTATPATPAPVNPTEQPKPTTATPATPAPVNPTEQPKPTPATPATPAPVNPTEQPKPTPATPATPAPVNPTEQPKPTTATPATPAPVNPTEQPKPTPATPATPAPVNPTEQPKPTTATPATPAPVNPTEQPKPTPATPATPAPVNPTEQPKPTTPTTATPAPVNPTEQPKPTPATPATPAPVNPTEQPKPTTPTTATPGSTNPTEQPKPTTPTPATPGSTNPTEQPDPTTPGKNNSTISTDSVSPATDPKPTIVPDICERLPCPSGSQCEARANNSRVCLCMAGDYFNEDSQRCETAKVFPGQLGVPALEFTDDMKNKTSPAFQRAAEQISHEVDLLFMKRPGYLGSIVLELKKMEPPKVRAVPGVIASVEMVFQTSAQIKAQDIEKDVTDVSTCEGCLLANSKFAKTKLCDKKPCDGKTTTCSEKDDGDFLCSCSKDYVTTEYSQRACVACPSGQEPNGTRECADCPYGYSGFNCNESWKLALVVVGSVFGGLLLITIIVLIVVATKAPKISKKTKKDLETRSHDVIHFTDKEPLVTSLPTNQQGSLGKSTPIPGVKPFPSGAVPRIPRATAASHWDSGINLEMTPSNSRPSSVAHERSSWLNDNPEDMNGGPYSRPRNQTNPYAQSSRPLNNPYSESQSVNNPYVQDRSRTNPYARNQGQSNPIYSHDNERPFNY
ncbi:proteoglycan 4-like [Syngnathus acus]|uniref:proteoglycan 4-like n=1 Tax=Syngnathus acus TaxID=161584 RepID=UPI001885CF9D|nr:proteoglycan 4-like [Syngnathus acus]